MWRVSYTSEGDRPVPGSLGSPVLLEIKVSRTRLINSILASLELYL